MDLTASASAADFIRDLNHRIGLPESLAAMGVTHGHIERLAKDAEADMASLTNPRPVSRSDYEVLFSAALEIA
jgi:alcohol dehydrogenase class IV